MRLIIRAWRPTLVGMVQKKTFRVRAFDADKNEVMGWRTLKCRTEQGAVQRLCQWMVWEGYSIDDLAVHVMEVTDA
jgi:hypothetical protein